MANEMEVSKGTWPIHYLGLPLGGNPNKSLFWEPVLTKIRKRTANWRRSYLSRGGRLLLLKSVLEALPTYYLSIFRIPKKLADKMEKQMRDFLWKAEEDTKGQNLVNWKQVCKDMTKGGLGIGGLRKINKALRGKWIWRMMENPTALWAKIIKSIHGSKHFGREAGICRKCSQRSPWKDIHSLYIKVKPHIIWQVGKGDNVLFWEDIWCGRDKLRNRYPNIFRMSNKKEGTVAEFLTKSSTMGSTQWAWNLHISCNIGENYLDEVNDILSLLHSFQVQQTATEDKPKCTLEQNRQFYVKSLKDSLSEQDPNGSHIPTDFIWSIKAPMKAKILIWLVSLNKLKTIDNVQKRHRQLYLNPNFCTLCRNSEESVNHIF